MNVKKLLAATLSVAVVAALAASGCGQAVATCDTICAFPDAPAQSCATTCASQQAACETAAVPAACDASFQAYLTCVGNTGSYASTNGICGTILGDGGGRAVDAAVDSPSGRCATTTCASLCASEGLGAASCTTGCEETATLCVNGASAFQGLLACICASGGLSPTSGDAITMTCGAATDALNAVCPGAIVDLAPDGGPTHP